MKAIMFLTWAIGNEKHEAQIVLDFLIRDIGGDPTEQEINRAMLMVEKFARYNSEVFPTLEARLK